MPEAARTHESPLTIIFPEKTCFSVRQTGAGKWFFSFKIVASDCTARAKEERKKNAKKNATTDRAETVGVFQGVGEVEEGIKDQNQHFASLSSQCEVWICAKGDACSQAGDNMCYSFNL